jgi:hypothetical protein
MSFKERIKKAYEEGREKGEKAGSLEHQLQRAEMKRQEKQEEKQYQKDRLAQLKKEHVPYCPKCHSTNITFVRKKLSLGRTVVGGVVGSLINPIAGGAGAVLGGLSSKKGKAKCLNCGKEWKL